jgi:Protein of unknown function (DUF2971)
MITPDGEWSTMPVTQQENDHYRDFVNRLAIQLGIFEVDQSRLIWHYTSGAGLLGILQSATLFATQVSALNDAKETNFATELYREAISALIGENQAEPTSVHFLRSVLKFVEEEPDNPTQGVSKFFVSCFSSEEDDNDQWFKYAKGHGRYAIGFHPRGLNREPNSSLFRVIYDRKQLEIAAKTIAKATLDFYNEGLINTRRDNPEVWAEEFFTAWDEWIYKLAPLAKAQKWSSEKEYRLVHELKLAEFPSVRFAQKTTMLARYLPLDFPSWVKQRRKLLPIGKVIVGPGDNPAATKVSVRLLLEQMGYTDVPVEDSDSTLIDR